MSPSADASSLERMTFEQMFSIYGPLIPMEKAWEVLGFPSRDALTRAIGRKRVPLRIVRPEGRKSTFLRSSEVSAYLAELAS